MGRKALWECKRTGAYDRDSDEALANVTEIWSFLHWKKWSWQATAGVLGNIEIESGYNPWRWENDNVLSTSEVDTKKGYGLFQFTPPSKYTNKKEIQKFPGFGPNFSNKQGNTSDGYAQLEYVDKYGDYIEDSLYHYTYEQFKVSTDAPEVLAMAWMYNYERPSDEAANLTALARCEAAAFWGNIIMDTDPPPPAFVNPKPLWLYMRRRTVIHYY